MSVAEKNPHYYKQIPPGASHIDVYRVLQMYKVTDPCLQHAIKKLLAAGQRGAGKDSDQDVDEAGQSIIRYKEMRNEEKEKILALPQVGSWVNWKPEVPDALPFLPLNTKVRIRTSDGRDSGVVLPYREWDWGYDISDGTIIGYQVVEDEE